MGGFWRRSFPKERKNQRERNASLETDFFFHPFSERRVGFLSHSILSSSYLDRLSPPPRAPPLFKAPHPLSPLMASTAMRSTAMRASTSSRAAAPPAARRLSVARTSGLAARRPSVLSQAQAAEELGFKEMRKGVKVRVGGGLCVSLLACLIGEKAAAPRLKRGRRGSRPGGDIAFFSLGDSVRRRPATATRRMRRFSDNLIPSVPRSRGALRLCPFSSRPRDIFLASPLRKYAEFNCRVHPSPTLFLLFSFSFRPPPPEKKKRKKKLKPTCRRPPTRPS